MRNNMLSLMASLALMSVAGAPEITPTRRRETIKEPKHKSLEERKEQFVKDIITNNEKQLINKHWIGFEVHEEIVISAMNKKNAVKTLEYLLKKHNLTL